MCHMSGTIPPHRIFVMDTARHLKKIQIRISNQMNTFSILQAEEHTVHILQAEEHQGQILFFFFLLFCFHLCEIQQISSWKSISTQADESYNLLEILEGYLNLLFASQHLAESREGNGLLASSHHRTDPVSAEID